MIVEGIEGVGGDEDIPLREERTRWTIVQGERKEEDGEGWEEGRDVVHEG